MHNVKVRMVGENTSIHQLIRKILKKKHSQPNKIVSLLEQKYVMHGMVILCCMNVFTSLTDTTQSYPTNDSFPML